MAQQFVLRWGAAVALAVCASAQTATAADEAFAAGLELRLEATAADIGLPLYPGSQPWLEPGEDKNAVSIGLWGGSFGFRVAALKLLSRDPLDDIAAYYRQALARHGALLDCSVRQPPPEPKKKDDKTLRCDDDKVPAGGRLYKAGTSSSNQRVVSLEPTADGVKIGLVRLSVRGD